MAIKDPTDIKQNTIDKAEIRRALEDSDARTGFKFDPSATPEQSRRLMRDLGIRPEDREFIRDLLRTRYGTED